MVSETPTMSGKTVLITGGTGGIGKATAIGLAALGARVAITGRDLGRAEASAADIRGATGNPDVDAFGADLSSQVAVRRLAAEVLEAYPRLDVLINNVGGFWNTRQVTTDGLERTFALNYLAPFLLTNLLLDRLKQSAPARVVMVSSGAHPAGRIDFDDLQGERSYSGATAYSQSKLASIRSPTSWPGNCRPAPSPPMRCIPAWFERLSGPRTPAASSDFSSHSCGLS